jgi:phage tail sheath protein FI
MALSATYPGVYVEEIPSGVHTIVGVSTAVAAFVGIAKSGPIGEPQEIFSFADYERTFGGLYSLSEMSYAVRQFFLNGGGEAWVVRAGGDISFAKRVLTNPTPVNVLDFQALFGGLSGNTVQLNVDHDTNVPGSTFNLSFFYPSLDSPQNAIKEFFPNLSMNPADARYALTMVNGVSNLVSLTLDVAVTNPPGVPAPALVTATSTGGLISDADVAATIVANLPARTLRIALGGGTITTVTFGAENTVAQIAATIQAQVQAAGASHPYTEFTCAPVGDINRNNPNAALFRLQCSIANTAAADSIRVLPGIGHDVSAAFKLGSVNGWNEVDPFESRRPVPMLASGTLFGGEITIHDTLPAGGSLRIQLDGDTTPRVIPIGDHSALTDLSPLLAAIAQDIQTQVQAQAAVVPAALQPAYQGFTVTVRSNNTLRLVSGSSGAGSKVVVTAGTPTDMAAPLQMTGAASRTIDGAVVTLTGGNEVAPPWDTPTTNNAYLGSGRADGLGIYALETHDFNMLVLAGVTDPAIVAAATAYCQERRAFFIADAPQGKSVGEMATYMAGTAVPKSDYGAMFYPYVQISDPLSGALRSSPPSGTIAGVHARTDGTRGVWKAAAGVADGVLTGVLGLDTVMTDAQNGVLNPLGLNALRIFPVYGVVCWGARTFLGADAQTSDYKYIPVRRLALFIESSLYQGTQWVVFEPNDEPLWAQIRLNVGAFMQSLFQRGAFQGTTPTKAYFVRCDSTTTTQNDINLGIVNIVVGFAPLKPAEFVVIQIQQIAGQLGT